MTLQKLETIPKDLFVDLDGLSVRPKVEYLGKTAKEMPDLARQDGLKQIYTDGIILVYNSLKRGREDNYSSLGKNQQSVRDGTYSNETMVDLLSSIGEEVLKKYWILAELGPDWQPEKRLTNYSLPKNSNAVLYRNWSLSGGKIDVSNAEVIPVRWMEESDDVSKEIIKGLNVPKGTRVWADKNYSVENYNGLNVLDWDFRDREGPGLYSDGGPGYGDSYGGALLCSVNAGVGKTESSFARELNNLEKDFEGLKKVYKSKTESIEQRIANLKKLKPE